MSGVPYWSDGIDRSLATRFSPEKPSIGLMHTDHLKLRSLTEDTSDLYDLEHDGNECHSPRAH